MRSFSRRRFIMSASAPLALAACGNGVGSRSSQKIDGRVDSALTYLDQNVAGTPELIQKAAGILVIPLVTEAGFGIGGSYGRGALRINGATVDYYSTTNASFGFQIGAQQYAHALFFMTEEALNRFRRSSGWAAGADIEYAISSNGRSFSPETTTAFAPVIGMVFGQAGLIAGATLEGTKYTRILP